jgi:hypothetical protein
MLSRSLERRCIATMQVNDTSHWNNLNDAKAYRKLYHNISDTITSDSVNWKGILIFMHHMLRLQGK